MKKNILILASGNLEVEDNIGSYPSFLIQNNGKSLLEKIINQTKSIENVHYYFTFLEKDVKKFHLDKIVELLVPGSDVVTISEKTLGSGCSALYVASKIGLDEELLIISANEYIDVDFVEVINSYRKNKFDAGTIIFESIHPRFSYVKINDEGLVIQAAQQNPISKNATVGMFWFKKSGDFVKHAKSMIKKDVRVIDKFFIAPVFNEFILEQQKIGVFKIESLKYHPLKTENHINNFSKDLGF
jgi:NDP-sugar pyrophosphorylase family protein